MIPRVLLVAVTLMAGWPLAAQRAETFPPFPKSQVKAASFAKRQAKLRPEYPGAAYKAGIGQGEARVGVLIGVDGKPLDFLVISSSHPAFGQALVAALKTAEYEPRRIAGVPVTGRFVQRYSFLPSTQMKLNVLDAPRAGGNLRSKLKTEARNEEELDAPLELVEAGLPKAPSGYVAPPDADLRALVTFYVDEAGNVRLPEVVSAPGPEFVANAIKAIQTWKFQPPLRAGEPTLVFTARPLPYVLREPAPAAP